MVRKIACSNAVNPTFFRKETALSWKVYHENSQNSLQNRKLTVKNYFIQEFFSANACIRLCIPLLLHRVFHSIRFKVNKVGIRRNPFFYVRTPCPRMPYAYTSAQRFSFFFLILRVFGPSLAYGNVTTGTSILLPAQ